VNAQNLQNRFCCFNFSVGKSRQGSSSVPVKVKASGATSLGDAARPRSVAAATIQRTLTGESAEDLRKLGEKLFRLLMKWRKWGIDFQPFTRDGPNWCAYYDLSCF